MSSNGKRQASSRRGGNGGTIPPVEHQFKKGKSGNPKGMAKGETLTSKLKRILEESDKKYGTKGEALMVIAERCARRGNFRFFKEIIERIDGKVPERLSGVDGGDLTVIVKRIQRVDRRD